MIIGHWLKHIQRMGIFVDQPTFKKGGQQEEAVEHLMFDQEVLEQVRFVTFCLESKDKGILQENMAGGILRYNRLMALSVVQS